MNISQKLILGFLGIAGLTGAVSIIAIRQQSETAKYFAQQEAQEVAGLLGYFASHTLEEHRSKTRDEILVRLQAHVLALHQERQRDMEIVDRNKIILADVVPEDIGTQLEHDANNEVTKTIQDGIPRTYIETSSKYPAGIQQIVIPLKTQNDAISGAVIVEYTPLYKAAMAIAQSSMITISAISLGCSTLALVVGYLISKSISKPIQQLQQAVLQLAKGNLKTRVTIHSQDEIGKLATSFNKMASDLQQSNTELVYANQQLHEEITERRLAEVSLQRALKDLQKTQTQMIQSEKMSSLGQLMAGIAHEINNPVNFIHGNLKPVQEYTDDLLSLVELYQKHYPTTITEIQAETERIELPFLQEDLPKILESMKMGTERIRQIVLSLRNFSRKDEAEFKAVDIHEGIDNTLLIVQYRLKAKSSHPEIKVVKDYDDLPLVECYPGQLNQAFMNIIVNAIDALEEAYSRQVNQEYEDYAGQITIQTAKIDSQQVQITISDNGIGMTEATLKRLFDPFFTTKPVGKGTGIGLSISYQIIEEKHDGKLKCSSIFGQGTEFIIQLPIRQPG